MAKLVRLAWARKRQRKKVGSYPLGPRRVRNQPGNLPSGVSRHLRESLPDSGNGLSAVSRFFRTKDLTVTPLLCEACQMLSPFCSVNQSLFPRDRFG